MKRNLEIAFMDGTKVLHHAEVWDHFVFRDDGVFRVEYNGEAFAWYPLRNIKSIMVIEEEDT